MTETKQIVLDVALDENGVFDASAVILQLQSKLGGRLVVTDWIDDRAIADRYPHLSEEERWMVLSDLSFNTGDYDDAVIDKEMRASHLDDVVVNAGYDVGPVEESDAPGL